MADHSLRTVEVETAEGQWLRRYRRLKPSRAISVARDLIGSGLYRSVRCRDERTGVVCDHLTRRRPS